MIDGPAFAYSLLLLGGLVQVANWLAPYENLTAEGCILNYVYDGDTVALDCGASRETARLIGFDAPETKEPGCAEEAAQGDAATSRLRALAAGGAATFAGHARDKFGRLLVVMRVNGQDVAEPLIAEGLAVPYTGGTRINWCERLGAS